MNPAKVIAEILLNLKAVSIEPHQPFTWASGMKSPIYCDNRLIISTVNQRQMVIETFAQTLASQYGPDVDVIAGTATAGIPHAAWLAHKTAKPMVYVRSSAKGHGKQNLIEGTLSQGAKTVLIEDLISTGGSSLKAADALKEAGAQVLGIIAIFEYGLKKAATAFESAQLPHQTLTDLPTLLNVAVEKKLLSKDDCAIVEAWQQDPAAWSKARGGA